MPRRLAQLKTEHPGQRVLTYYQDEARFGQHGTLTRVWAKVGSRPPAIRQTQYDYLYVFSAVCPETGDAAGLITPNVNTGTMNAFLEQFAAQLPPDVHAAMVLDRAGWHTAAALVVPANVTLIRVRLTGTQQNYGLRAVTVAKLSLDDVLCPELNPVENLWHYLRSHYWSNRLYPTWEDLKQAAVAAWRAVCLVPELIKSVCADTAVRAN